MKFLICALRARVNISLKNIITRECFHVYQFSSFNHFLFSFLKKNNLYFFLFLFKKQFTIFLPVKTNHSRMSLVFRTSIQSFSIRLDITFPIFSLNFYKFGICKSSFLRYYYIFTWLLFQINKKVFPQKKSFAIL